MRVQPLSDRELTDMYHEMLEEIYGEVKVCGYEFSAADVLKEMDPVAYKVGLNDWLDSECSDGTIKEVNGEYYMAEDLPDEEEETEED
jgi:hypothetical protein